MTNQSTYEKAIVGKYAKIARLDFANFLHLIFFFNGMQLYRNTFLSHLPLIFVILL